MLRPRLAIVLALLAGLETASAEEEFRSLENDDCAAAIVFHDETLDEPNETNLVCAVWSDGFFVWSENPIEGGAPYFAGKITPDEVADFREKLVRDGYLVRKPPFDTFATGPHYPYTTIRVTADKQSLTLTSWHEYGEEGGEAAAFSEGLSLIGEKSTRLQTTAKSDPSYLMFRIVWLELRQEMDRMRPDEKIPVRGLVVYREGHLYWHLP